MRSPRTKGSHALPFVVLPLLAMGLTAGCADVAGDALQQDVSQLRQDVNALKLAANRSRGEADAIAQSERRMREQSADTNRQINTLSTRLEALASELNRVSNRLDDVSRRLETASRMPATPRPPATTFATPSTPASPPPVASAPTIPTPPPPSAGIPGTRVAPSVPAIPPPPAITTPTPPSSTPPAPAPSVTAPRPTSPLPSRSAAGATAEEAYQAAYLDFSRGRYELALTGFRDFLRRYPDSPLADSAQYGIGESYYSMATQASSQNQADKATRALEQSVQEFRKVVVVYPRGAKVPSALYKEGLALTELKQPAIARARLQYLVDHFPQSEEAPLAKERLTTLK